MEKQPLTLREQQLEYLEILKEFDRFCTEKGIRYYIGWGTLIGAVRHKGFIPWDDDLDVLVPRPDFMKLVDEYSSSSYSFHTIYNDRSHPYLFGRFCTNKVYSYHIGKPFYDFGIDVYTINGAPTSIEEQQIFIKKVFKQKKKARNLNRFRNRLIRRNLWPFKSMEFGLLHRQLLRAEKELTRYDYETCEYIWPFGLSKSILKKDLYGTPVKLQFEDGFFNAPEHFHEVLTINYGDYMQLPQEDERKPRHCGVFYWAK